jgi:hypothetical protein
MMPMMPSEEVVEPSPEAVRRRMAAALMDLVGQQNRLVAQVLDALVYMEGEPRAWMNAARRQAEQASDTMLRSAVSYQTSLKGGGDVEGQGARGEGHEARTAVAGGADEGEETDF